MKNLLVRKQSSFSMVIVLIAISLGTRLFFVKTTQVKAKEELSGALNVFTMAIMQINAN